MDAPFRLSWTHYIQLLKIKDEDVRNYYDRKVKLSEEKSTISIILCKEGNKMVVEFTLPEHNKQIFAKEYKAVLPSKEELKKQLQY